MNNREAVNWLINILADIGKVEHSDLWHYEQALTEIKDMLESEQPEPSEITDEQAILHLQSTGWMQNHDREMYESGLRKQLADDSGSYDSLIPCEDTISRQAAIDALLEEVRLVGYYVENNEVIDKDDAIEAIRLLPSAQPEEVTPHRNYQYLSNYWCDEMGWMIL